MKTKVLATIFLACLTVTGCQKHSAPGSADVYPEITNGMSREAVERLTGQPTSTRTNSSGSITAEYSFGIPSDEVPKGTSCTNGAIVSYDEKGIVFMKGPVTSFNY
jgi:hypothetical protein